MEKSGHKIKVAIFFGYNGRPFSGLQKNSNSFTIEESLELTFNKMGLILPSNFGDLKKMGWGRGSRTDKGVHALLNVIKCKLEISDKYLSEVKSDAKEEKPENKTEFRQALDLEKLRQDMNLECDPNIKVFAIMYVTKNFCCKASARSRKYEYYFPLRMLDREGDTATPAEKVAEFQALMSAFKGTKNYHNYTTKGDSHKQSNNRIIFDIKCSHVELDHPKAAEEESFRDKKLDYVKVNLHGQSFIYHQIRKMIGGGLFAFKNKLGSTYIENTLTKNKSNIWLAPSEGLMLDRITFENYNNKKDIPMKLEVTQSMEKEVEEFKAKTIIPTITKADIEDEVFTKWLKWQEEGGDPEERGWKGKKAESESVRGDDD